MLQNPCKTLGFKKNMVYKIPPGGGGKPYPASGLLWGNYDFLAVANKVIQFSNEILIFILVKEIVLYTGKSRLEAPLILWDSETVPYQVSFNDLYYAQ